MVHCLALAPLTALAEWIFLLWNIYSSCAHLQLHRVLVNSSVHSREDRCCWSCWIQGYCVISVRTSSPLPNHPQNSSFFHPERSREERADSLMSRTMMRWYKYILILVLDFCQLKFLEASSGSRVGVSTAPEPAA